MDIEDQQTATEEAPADTTPEVTEQDADDQNSSDESNPSEGSDADENPSGEEETEQTEQTEKPAEVPAAPEVSDYLLLRAESLGLSREEALDFAASKSLEKVLIKLERMAAPKPEKGTEKAPEKTEDEFKIDLDAENYDPKIVKQFEAMKSHYDSKLQAIQQSFQGVLQHAQRQQQHEFFGWFDDQIVGLGEEYADVFGKDPAAKLKEGSPHDSNRRKVLEAMETIAGGCEKRGQKAPNRKELLSQAIRLAFGDKQKSLVRKELSKSIQKRQGQMISRGTNRDSKSGQQPYERAVSNVARMLRDKGIDPEDGGDLEN